MNKKKVAIIGIGGLFPEADDLPKFYQNLREGRDSIRPLSANRIDSSLLDPSKEYRIMGHLDRVDEFDHAFFNISRREAGYIDPAQRLLLELSVTAIENAGYSLDALAGTATDVYIGIPSLAHYAGLVNEHDPSAFVGNLPSMAAGRIAYHLNLCGAALAIDTTCSSSLVAVHEACRSIMAGQCTMALAGGVKVHARFAERVEEDNLGIASRDGKTRSFDIRSDGTGDGEGGGIVVLKDYDQAVADGDHIHAVILGTAANQDGARSNGITSPSPIAQEEVVRQAWNNAGIEPATITYIEAHGTGTRIGDPIEVQALNKAFKGFTNEKAFCALSALKSNIGHLDNAAGIAGLIKAVLSLRNEEIFPVVHFSAPNPMIDLKDSPLFINDKLRKWTTDGTPRRCGISSFGFIGTNAHVILEEAPPDAHGPVATDDQLVVKVSAKTPAAFARAAAAQADYFSRTDIHVQDACFTLNTGRSDHKHRACVVAGSSEELVQRLRELSATLPAEAKSVSAVLLADGAALSPALEQKLYSNYTVFRAAVEEAEAAIDKTTPHFEAFRGTYALMRLVLSFGLQLRAVIATGVGSVVNKTIRQSLPLSEAAAELSRLDLKPVDTERLQKLLATFPSPLLLLDMGHESKLSAAVRQAAGDQEVVIESLLADVPSGDPLLSIARLYGKGLDIDWSAFHQGRGSRVEAPTYSFEKIRCWYREGDAQGPASLSFYSYEWQAAPLDPSATASAKTLLVLSNDGSDEALGTALAGKGYRAIWATPANDGNNAAGQEYRFGPLIGDYVHLLEEAGPIDGVVDLTGLAGAALPHHVRLQQALALAHVSPEIPLTVFIREDMGANDISSFYKTLLTEAGRRLRIVSIDASASLSGLLPGEIAAEDAVAFVAYRNGLRHTQAILPVKLETTALESSLSTLQGGNFVIDGDWSEVAENLCRLLVDLGANSIAFVQATASQAAGRPVREVLDSLSSTGTIITWHSYRRNNNDEHREALAAAAAGLKDLHGVLYLHQETLRASALSAGLTDVLELAGSSLVKRLETLDAITRAASPLFFTVLSSANVDGAEILQQQLLLTPIERFVAGRSGSTLYRSCAWINSKSAAPVESGRWLRNCLAFSGVRELPPILVGANAATTGLRPGALPVLAERLIASATPLTRADETPAAPLSQTTMQKIEAVWKEVLMTDSVREEDDFFELGGHSLNGVQVINKINKLFGTRLTLDDIFEHGTLRELSDLVDSLRPEDEAEEAPADDRHIHPVPAAPNYVLSKSQRRMWLMSQSEQGSVTYSIPLNYIIDGDIDLVMLEKSVQAVVDRHESLRTLFVMDKGEPRQQVLTPASARFRLGTADVRSEADPAAAAAVLVQQESKKAFRLDQDLLIRMLAIRVEEREYFLHFNIHHIISDAWSLSLMFQEILGNYQRMKEGTFEPLAPPSLQYKDYAEWQHRLITSGRMDESRKYWGKALAGPYPPFTLPTDFPRPDVQSFDGDGIEMEVAKKDLDALRNLAMETNTTLYIVVLAAFKTLIFHYSGHRDVILGTDLAGRVNADTEGMLGMFINVMAIRSHPHASATFRDYLNDVKQSFLQAVLHQEYQFDDIVADLLTDRDLARNPFFDVMFLMQNNNAVTAESGDLGFSITPVAEGSVKSPFDLTIQLVDNKRTLVYLLKYNTNLFKRSTIEALGAQYLFLLGFLSENSQVTLAEASRALADFTRERKKQNQMSIRTRNIAALKNIQNKQ